MSLSDKPKVSWYTSWLLVLLTGSVLVMSLPETSLAQDGDDAAAVADDPVDGDGNDAETKKQQSVLMWAIGALGIPYSVVFLSLSVTLVALFVMNVLTLSRDNICPQALSEGFDNHLTQKEYQEAYELAKTDDSFLGKVLSAGLAKLQAGYSHAVEAMQEVGEEEQMKLDHRLSYIQLIGTISPMIGLLGTVQGMIQSFYKIANASGGTPPADELAEGISKALFTTLIGLMIAIPAIAIFSILRNRIARLVLEVGITSESLMGRFENVGTQQQKRVP